MEPLPGGFDMLQYFETILPLVVYFRSGGAAGGLWRHQKYCHFGFYQELEKRLKPREMLFFGALYENKNHNGSWWKITHK